MGLTREAEVAWYIGRGSNILTDSVTRERRNQKPVTGEEKRGRESEKLVGREEKPVSGVLFSEIIEVKRHCAKEQQLW